jgi:proline dehydrogenase
MFNKLIAALLPFMPQRFVWIFSKRYVAGLNINEAIEVCKKLNAEGIKITLDILGEFIKTLDEAETNAKKYMEAIEITQQQGIDGNYSVKPTMFGLLLDKEMCYQYIRQIVAKAASYNNFIRIDMEDSPCTDMEIELFRKLHQEFPTNVGLVLQAYLKRTKTDIENMLDMNAPEIPVNYRLCKGIYIEPAAIAYKDHDEIIEHYLNALELMFQNKIYVGIATHDKKIIDSALELIKKYNVPKNKYEFQMLYGVTPELRQSIVDAEHTMRVYVPYGQQWFNYCTRRLKENPKMAGMIVKALFVRG